MFSSGALPYNVRSNTLFHNRNKDSLILNFDVHFQSTAVSIATGVTSHIRMLERIFRTDTRGSFLLLRNGMECDITLLKVKDRSWFFSTSES